MDYYYNTGFATYDGFSVGVICCSDFTDDYKLKEAILKEVDKLKDEFEPYFKKFGKSTKNARIRINFVHRVLADAANQTIEEMVNENYWDLNWFGGDHSRRQNAYDGVYEDMISSSLVVFICVNSENRFGKMRRLAKELHTPYVLVEYDCEEDDDDYEDDDYEDDDN